MKIMLQKIARSGLTQKEITGELEKPLNLALSYDPNRPTTPTSLVRLYNGEREYQFSGFKLDAGETGAVHRHTRIPLVQ